MEWGKSSEEAGKERKNKTRIKFEFVDKAKITSGEILAEEKQSETTFFSVWSKSIPGDVLGE